MLTVYRLLAGAYDRPLIQPLAGETDCAAVPPRKMKRLILSSVERNPARSGISDRAQDWPWLSTSAHLRGAGNALVKVRPLLELIRDRRSHFSAPDADEVPEQLHLDSCTSRPLGADDFVKGIEARVVRRLRPRKPSPSQRLRINEPGI